MKGVFLQKIHFYRDIWRACNAAHEQFHNVAQVLAPNLKYIGFEENKY